MPHPGISPAAAQERTKPSFLAVWSWIAYDLANTIFSMNIVSFFFSIWVVNIMGGRDGHYALANSLSMALIFLISPYLGALTDQAARRMPFLVVATFICVLFTSLLGLAGLGFSLLFFAAANVAYQAGLQFYDALLPEVSRPATRGRVGGAGVAVGYFGSLLGLAVGHFILDGSESITPAARAARYVTLFQTTAALFLLFALPCFFFVRERTRPGRHFTIKSLAEAGRQVAATFASLKRFPTLTRFLAGRAFYTDAINTIIAFMGIYVTTELGFSSKNAINVMILGVLFAALGGFILGPVVDRVGPARVLRWILLVWMALLAWTAAVGFLDFPAWSFWIVPPLTGIALGGTWTADRPLMLSLTPSEKIGEYYGLYGMVGRFSSITGPLLWAFVAETLGLGRPTAVLSLMLFIIVAHLLLRPISRSLAGPLSQ